MVAWADVGQRGWRGGDMLVKHREGVNRPVVGCGSRGQVTAAEINMS